MTTLNGTATGLVSCGDAAKPQQSLPFIIAASSCGTLIEWYDFYLYGVLAGFFATLFNQRIMGLVPTGSTSRPKEELVTSAKLVYMASAPQTIPIQPPACVSAATPKSAPKPSR
jgi:hypothetical protein